MFERNIDRKREIENERVVERESESERERERERERSISWCNLSPIMITTKYENSQKLNFCFLKNEN